MPNKIQSTGKGGMKNEKTSAVATDISKVYTRLRVFWNLNFFSRHFVKNSASSSVIDSHPFEMNIQSNRNKTKWFLRIYPNGNEQKKSCVGIHLVKRSEYSKDYEYSCRFSILKGDVVVISKHFKARASENESIGQGYGFMLFLSHGELFQWFDKFIDNGSQLTIRADIELSASKIDGDEEESTVVVLRDAFTSSMH